MHTVVELSQLTEEDRGEGERALAAASGPRLALGAGPSGRIDGGCSIILRGIPAPSLGIDPALPSSWYSASSLLSDVHRDRTSSYPMDQVQKTVKMSTARVVME